MASLQPSVLGRDIQCFVMNEESIGFFYKPGDPDGSPGPAGTDTDHKLEVRSAQIAHVINREMRRDSQSSQSVFEDIEGNTEVTWSIDAFLMPSGLAGTPPDIHQLLLATFGHGGYTNTPGTSDVYVPNGAQGDRGSLSIIMHYNGIYSVSCSGAIVDSMTINASGTDTPSIVFSGRAQDYCHTGYTTLSSAAATGDGVPGGTEIEVNNLRNVCAPNSLIKIGDDDNGGLGYIVVEVTDTGFFIDNRTNAQRLANSPANTGLQGAGEAINSVVTPFVPTLSTSGSPISVIDGDVSGFYQGASAPLTAFSLTVANGNKVFDDQIAVGSYNDYAEGFRDVTGSFAIRMLRDQLVKLGQRDSPTSQFTRGLDLTLGTVAGKMVQIDDITARLGFEAPSISDDDAIANFPFQSFAIAGDDEVRLTFK